MPFKITITVNGCFSKDSTSSRFYEEATSRRIFEESTFGRMFKEILICDTRYKIFVELWRFEKHWIETNICENQSLKSWVKQIINKHSNKDIDGKSEDRK